MRCRVSEMDAGFCGTLPDGFETDEHTTNVYEICATLLSILQRESKGGRSFHSSQQVMLQGSTNR
jgi:hypothetical protein